MPMSTKAKKQIVDSIFGFVLSVSFGARVGSLFLGVRICHDLGAIWNTSPSESMFWFVKFSGQILELKIFSRFGDKLCQWKQCQAPNK